MQPRGPLGNPYNPSVQFTDYEHDGRRGEVQPPPPAAHLHEGRMWEQQQEGGTPPRDFRETSVSPGAESRGTATYSALGDEEKVILNSVIARLQHGIDLAGQRAEGARAGAGGLPHIASPPHHAHGHDTSALAPQSGAMRQQLDRAGILIGQQLETSARKDILMQQIEAFAGIEKLHLQIQLETMYDHLTGERDHYCMQEQQFQKKLEKARRAAEADQQAMDEARADYEERMRVMSLAHQEALEELEKKNNEMRKESRHELQEAGERLSEAISSSEHQRREEKQARDDEAESLAFYLEELETRNELLLEALGEAHHLHVIIDKQVVVEPAPQPSPEQAPQEAPQETPQDQGNDQDEATLDEQSGGLTASQHIASLQEEVASLREQLEDALQAAQGKEDDDVRQQEERERLRALVETLQGEVETCKEDFAVKSLELESNLLVMGQQGGTTAINIAKESLLYLDELVQTQQDAGRFFIMYQQLQELLCFVLQRYAPHWSAEPADDPAELEEQSVSLDGTDPQETKYRGIYPSYWGWLYKSTGMFVSWQRRFFVIRDGVLRMSASGDPGIEAEWGSTGSFKTVLRVESIARVELESFQDAAQGNHPPTGKYESFGFMLETYSRQRIKLCCTSSSERAEWMSILRRCNEIRLNNERFKSCNCEGEPSPEPYLYLEYASPPGPPPTYRTRVRMNECGAYPMVGPGSPPRAYLAGVPQYVPPSVSIAASVQPTTKARRESYEHQSPPPPRPVLIQGDKSTPRKGKRAAPQLGGASGIGRPHSSVGSPSPAARIPPSAAGTPHRKGGGTAGRRPSVTTAQPSPGASMKSLPSEVASADLFEGIVPLDVLLVKSRGGDGDDEEEEGQVRATAHSFLAKFKGSYERIQIYYCGQTRGCVLASAVFCEVLGVTDSPTMVQAEVSGVLKLLNNMAAQPVVPGSPTSLLTILIGPDTEPCTVDQLGTGLVPQCPIPIPLYSAALFSSLYVAHRNSLSWGFVTQVDGN